MSNLAPSGTVTTSYSTTSSFFSASGAASEVNDGVTSLTNGYIAVHSDTFTTNQDNTVTISYEVDFSTEKTIKRYEAYKSAELRDYLTDLDYANDVVSSPERPQTHTVRFYTWNGLSWDLQDTQAKDISGVERNKLIGVTVSNVGAITEVVYNEGNWTTSKIKIEVQVDYELIYNGSAGQQDYFNVGLSEIRLYDDLSDSNINLNQSATATITGGLTTQNGNINTTIYTVDGFDGTGIVIGTTSYSGLTVYDAVIDLGGTYNLTELSIDHEAVTNDFGELPNIADVDWEMQYFTTEWVSAATGSRSLGQNDSYTATDTVTGEFNNVTKTRVVMSFDTTIVQPFFDAFKFSLSEFKAYTAELLLADIGLRVGSQSIGGRTDRAGLSIYVDDTVYDIELVDPSASDASAVRMYVGGEVKAWREYT